MAHEAEFWSPNKGWNPCHSGDNSNILQLRWVALTFFLLFFVFGSAFLLTIVYAMFVLTLLAMIVWVALGMYLRTKSK